MNWQPTVAPYDAGAYKLLSDNRLAYFAQSERTTTGRAADFAEAYAREQSPIDPINYADRRGF